MTGLSIDTLRAWERRYQAVVPVRDERGRVYDPGQIRRLILLRDAVERGHQIGKVAALRDSELQALLAVPATTKSSPQPTDNGQVAGDLVQPIVAAIEAFDCAAANAQLGRLAAVLSVSELVSEVVLPLMRLVGERWHAGTLTIAQEHMTSAILRSLLGGMVRTYAPKTETVRLMFATPAGDMHEFGILAAAMLAVDRGFEAVYLGPNLPASEIVAAAGRTRPRAVILGIKQVEKPVETVAELSEIAAELPDWTELWLGGDDARKFLPAVGHPLVCALESFEELEVELVRLKEGRR